MSEYRCHDCGREIDHGPYSAKWDYQGGVCDICYMKNSFDEMDKDNVTIPQSLLQKMVDALEYYKDERNYQMVSYDIGSNKIQRPSHNYVTKQKAQETLTAYKEWQESK